MEIKSGVKTSEFRYATFVPAMVSLGVFTLLSLGIIGEADVQTTEEMLSQAMSGVMSLVLFVNYVIQRSSIKKQALKVEEVRLSNQMLFAPSIEDEDVEEIG